MRRIEKHKKELAANYADYANGAHQELFFAPHSRNRRNSRLILYDPIFNSFGASRP